MRNSVCLCNSLKKDPFQDPVMQLQSWPLSYAGNIHRAAPPMCFLVPLTVHSLPICLAVLKEQKGPSSYKSVFASDKWCSVSLRAAWVVFLFLKCFNVETKFRVKYAFKNKKKIGKKEMMNYFYTFLIIWAWISYWS